MHLKITRRFLSDIIAEIIDEDGSDTLRGICFSCGTIHDRCEPDAEDYECENCGENNVQGMLNCAMEIG
jgi:hypothetical protein